MTIDCEIDKLVSQVDRALFHDDCLYCQVPLKCSYEFTEVVVHRLESIIIERKNFAVIQWL